MKFFKTVILLASASMAKNTVLPVARLTTVPKEIKMQEIPKLVQVVDGIVEGYTGEQLSTDYTICVADAIEASVDIIKAIDWFEDDTHGTYSKKGFGYVEKGLAKLGDAFEHC